MKLFKRSSPPPKSARQVTMLGRTLAYSYHARRSDEHSVLGRQLLRDALSIRQAKRAAHYWKQRFGLFLVILAVLIGVGNLLALDTEVTIKPIAATTPMLVHSTQVYATAAQRLLDASALNRNKITVDVNGVTRALKREFPELSVVSITLPVFGHRPVVYIAQSDPALLLTRADGTSYVIDAEGRAIAKGDSAGLDTSSLVAVRDESSASIQLGQLTVPTTTVDFIKTIQFQLGQRQTHVDHFVLPQSSGELDVYLKDHRYFIKCNVASGTALEQAGTFLALQQYFEGRGIVPGSYVDVRLDGRAYYR